MARPLVLGFGLLMWTSLAMVTGDITFALMLCVASLAFVPPEVVRGLVDRRAQPVAAAS